MLFGVAKGFVKVLFDQGDKSIAEQVAAVFLKIG
ncbi:MAG: hypothetical protein ACD_39C00173G0001 [uncultured bacterium]|nr:MAG: hypothetical protein ACD_39C00173G0001 [uncultured bacterium]